jgi:hypothetical protein
MLENATAPADIWRVQEYLYEQRKTVDRIYRYSYSGLMLIFSILMRDGWLTEADLVGPNVVSRIRMMIYSATIELTKSPFRLLLFAYSMSSARFSKSSSVSPGMRSVQPAE